MIDISNPEEDVFLDIEYYTKEGVPGLLRNTATRIKQQGYYTLGDFFNDVSGKELQAMNILINDCIKRGTGYQDSYNFLFLLTTMLMVAQGHQACKIKDITASLHVLVGIILDETIARDSKPPSEMPAIRKTYDIDKKGQDEKQQNIQ